MKKNACIKDVAIRWNLSERTIRHYCETGRIAGAKFENGLWSIPEDASKPERKNKKDTKNYLLERLRVEKQHGIKGGVYHKLQVDMTYNSNHIEGNELSHDQTRYIFETRTIGTESKNVMIDDIIETIHHFTAIDKVIDSCNYLLSEAFIKELHRIIKTGTSDSRLPRFAVGDYKKEPNVVGDSETTHPRLVAKEMEKLLGRYNTKESHDFEEIVEFHANFEKIHPFQDGNGRVGRLVVFKECLKNNIVPFIIMDRDKMFYYRGLQKWNEERGWLMDTCLHGQDIVKSYLDYFNIPYKK